MVVTGSAIGPGRVDIVSVNAIRNRPLIGAVHGGCQAHRDLGRNPLYTSGCIQHDRRQQRSGKTHQARS